MTRDQEAVQWRLAFKEASYNIAGLIQENCGNSVGSIELLEADVQKQRAISQEGDEATTRTVSDMYMLAALKLLRAGVLTESAQSSETYQNRELLLDIYNEAARLFKLCAAVCERNTELAGAILAYKCMGAARMRLIDIKHPNILRSVDKLQSLPWKIQPVNNLIISVDLLPSFGQVMQYMNDTKSVMEALSKSEHLFLAIKTTSTPLLLGAASSAQNLLALRNVLDFDLHNMGGLIQEVMNTVERIGLCTVYATSQTHNVCSRDGLDYISGSQTTKLQ